MKLLTRNNAKTNKGEKKGYLTLLLHLAPADLSGVMNVCSNASVGCKAACLNTAGRGGLARKDGVNIVQNARIARTQFLYSNRKEFMAQLDKEINIGIKYAEKKGLIPCIRLNGTSDLAWESEVFTGGLMQKYSHVQWYDYTKIAARALKWAKGEMPSNYHLTFSWNEEEKNHKNAAIIAKEGGNIAVVFSPFLPETFLGLPVVNGDETDLRFRDPKNVVVGLTPKGKAKDDDSGFVVKVA